MQMIMITTMIVMIMIVWLCFAKIHRLHSKDPNDHQLRPKLVNYQTMAHCFVCIDNQLMRILWATQYIMQM